MTTETTSLRDRLRAAVPAAIKARDRHGLSALRCALSAIDNAEAVDVAADVTADDRAARAGAIEASPVGLGVTEVARRQLTEAEVSAIVRAEIETRREAAAAFEASGHGDRAAELTAGADALAGHLG